MTWSRARGLGSVYFVEKSGLWRASISLPNGKRKVKASRFQKEVKDWLIKERSRSSDGYSDDRITLEAFLTRYLDDYCKRSLRSTTFQGYKSVIEDHIIPELGTVRLSQLRADQINHLLSKKLDAKLSNRFVEYIHGILKRSLNVATKWGLLAKNPALMVTPPKPVYKIPHTWSMDQVKSFLEVLKDDRWAAIYYLGCGTGMRKGEVLGLPLSALDLDKGYLMVVQTLQLVNGKLELLEPKTQKSRRLIVLPDFVKEALRVHLFRRGMIAQSPAWKESGLVFTSDIGTPIFPRNLVRHFKTKLTEAGLPDIRFHDLRHTTASLLLEKNVHPKIVSELLGHSTITLTLNTYSHIINPINKVASSEMDDMFGSRSVEQLM
jgi:integrase